MSDDERGYRQIVKTNDVAAPASGATATLFTTTAAPGKNRGHLIKALIINIESSHDSATDGLVISESDNDGTTWKTIYTRTYTQATDGRLKVIYKLVGAPDVRVQFINSANTLSTWRFSVFADEYERG